MLKNLSSHKPSVNFSVFPVFIINGPGPDNECNMFCTGKTINCKQVLLFKKFKAVQDRD